MNTPSGKRFKNKSHVVIIKPIDKNQPYNATFSEISKKIDSSGREVNRVRNIANGGIAIELSSKSEVTKLKYDATVSLGQNYVVSIPEKNLPKIKVFGLRESYTPQQIAQSLREKNQQIFDENSTIHVVHCFSNKKKTLHGFKFETDSLAFQKILAARRLSILWKNCLARECIDVERCYNCWGFYHKSKNCTSKICCGKCGAEHSSEVCTATSESCVNCKMANEKFKNEVDTNHGSSSNDCMVYKHQVELRKKRIDYG